MCILTGKTTKRRTGYKVLAYNGKNFYSTFTGQIIKIGKVPKPPRSCKRMTANWNTGLDYSYLKDLVFYHPNFVGKTSAFTKLYDALFLFKDIDGSVRFKNIDIVLTKITFDNTAYTGFYDRTMPIIASDTIKDIKIIK